MVDGIIRIVTEAITIDIITEAIITVTVITGTTIYTALGFLDRAGIIVIGK